MVILNVDPSIVRLSGEDQPSIVAANVALLEGLKSKNPQAHMHNQKIDRRWSKPVPYWHEAWDAQTQSFPRGLLPRAVGILLDAGIAFHVASVDRGECRILQADINESPQGFTPRDYQLEAVRHWLRHEYGTVVVPTRGGKTLIGCLAAEAAVKSGMSVLWLVTKVEAKSDVKEAWKRQGGLDGLDVMTYRMATGEDLTKYHFVIADEVHRTAADTYYKSIQSATNAWYRLGMTGTPSGRSDGKEIFIEGAVGPVVFEVPRGFLVERGLCSSGEAWRIQYGGPVSMPPSAHGNWTKIEKYGIVENGERDQKFIEAIKKARDGKDTQVLVLCRRKAHAEAFAAKLSDEFGLDVPAVHSGRSKKIREEIYSELSSGECRMAVGTGIYDDSMTFPHLKVLAIAAGGKSPILTGQRMGRVLSGNKKIIVIDSSDKHWHTLQEHSKRRFAVYTQEGCITKDVTV